MALDSRADVPAARSPRWLKAALIASLAANLLIIGTIAGSIWAFRHGATWGAHAFNVHLLGFTSTLGAERRAEIWKATRQERHALRPLRKELRKTREDARNVLVTEPYDAQKFAEAQNRVLDAEIKARREATNLFLAIAKVLTPAERAAFGRWEPEQRAARARAWRRNRPPHEDAEPADSDQSHKN